MIKSVLRSADSENRAVSSPIFKPQNQRRKPKWKRFSLLPEIFNTLFCESVRTAKSIGWKSSPPPLSVSSPASGPNLSVERVLKITEVEYFLPGGEYSRLRSANQSGDIINARRFRKSSRDSVVRLRWVLSPPTRWMLIDLHRLLYLPSSAKAPPRAEGAVIVFAACLVNVASSLHCGLVQLLLWSQFTFNWKNIRFIYIYIHVLCFAFSNHNPGWLSSVFENGHPLHIT